MGHSMRGPGRLLLEESVNEYDRKHGFFGGRTDYTVD